MSLQNIFNKDLVHRVDCEYDRDYPSWTGCTCSEDDYCRCTMLKNIRMSTPYTPTFVIAKTLAEEVKEQRGEEMSAIQQYALERFLRIKLGQDGLDVRTSPGYYGEEIGPIYVNDRKRLWGEYQPFLNCADDAELMRMILMLDYGYIPESIQGFTRATIDLADLQSIKIGNHEHLNGADDRDTAKTYGLQWFKSWKKDVLDTDIPLCVCRKSGDFLMLVDGYHRYSTLRAKAPKDVTFFVIVLE